MKVAGARGVLAAFALALAAGCGASGDGPAGADAAPDALVCPPNAAPFAPTILEPLAGRIDVVSSELVIVASVFGDPDGDGHGGTEVEIWSVQGGAPVGKVWEAALAAPLTQVTLGDGQFLAGSDLVAWEDYAVRVRYRDDRGACARWGPWSEDRGFRTDDGSSYLFDPDAIRDIYLEIPPESWEAIDAEAYPPGCVPFQRSYHPARLIFEEQVFDGVGLHIKGGCGSARDLGGKPAFKVNLDWDDPAVPGCPAERRLLGQKHLTINSGVQDPTLEHERLGYEIYQAFDVPTPRAATVRLHVNSEWYGVYTLVETIDRRFLERWFASKDGMLYEGTYWCDLVPGNVPPGEGDDSWCLSREFKESPCETPDDGADPLTYELLRDFVQRIDAMPIGQFYPEIEAFFDFDTFLSQWAIEGVISHWDAYEFSIMNNYRVYHDPETDRWSMIPTGIDQTFAGDQEPWDVYGVLAYRCLQEPDCEAAFADRLAAVNDWFESADLRARAQQIYDQISPDVLLDTRKEVSNGGYVSAVSELYDYLQSRPTRVRELLSAHGF